MKTYQFISQKCFNQILEEMNRHSTIRFSYSDDIRKFVLTEEFAEKFERILRSFLNPEEFGLACSASLRDEVRLVLGMKMVETV